MSILVVGELCRHQLEGAPGVGDVGSNQGLVGEQSVSAHVNIPTSTVKPKHKHLLNGYWVVLWKETYVWTTLEPLPNVCPWHVWNLINFKREQFHMFVKGENIN